MRMAFIIGGLVGTVFALVFAVHGIQDRIDKQRERTTAVIACIENTAYTRPLIRQCIADYEQLRNLISPGQSLTLLDDFAKWLFASSAIVGALGTSFGISGANDLGGWGKKMFAIAVAAVGVSLALSAFARLPLRITVNRYSPEDMASSIGRLTRRRGCLLFWAASLFALGLVLAGLAPLFS